MLEILTLSYNINNKKLALEEVFDFINRVPYNIIAIGIQECYFDIEKKLYGKYKFFYYKKMYGLHLVVLSKINLKVDFSIFCLGPYYFGNKGFILVNINNYLLFSNVHLQHGEGDRKTRDKQFLYIENFLNKLNVPKILLGDFNYSFKKRVKKYIESVDEFNSIKEKYDYLELNPNFNFTYKYLNCIIDENRIPSYCDRIIYKNLECLKYSSLHDFNKSDHKPVFGIFLINDNINYAVKLEKSILSMTSCFIYENSYVIFFICIFFIVIYLLNSKSIFKL